MTASKKSLVGKDRVIPTHPLTCLPPYLPARRNEVKTGHSEELATACPDLSGKRSGVPLLRGILSSQCANSNQILRDITIIEMPKVIGYVPQKDTFTLCHSEPQDSMAV